MNSAIVHLHKKLQSSLSMKFNMEQCFRIALWMCLLIGCLQAKPTPSPCFENDDLRLSELKQRVNCDHVNVTFTSTTNVQKNCNNATLKLFEKGLQKAKTNGCTDVYDDIGVTQEGLSSTIELTQADSPGCKLETKETQFKDFVENLQSFVEQLNVMCARGTLL